jgi:hypothetical protein
LVDVDSLPAHHFMFLDIKRFPDSVDVVAILA